MVERLKIAVEKARARRARSGQTAPAAAEMAAPAPPVAAPAGPEAPLQLGSPAFPQTAPAAPPEPAEPADAAARDDAGGRSRDLRRAAAWNTLAPIELSPRHLERNRIISYAKDDPAHVPFDVLRTRMTSALARNGWTRVGITSPDAACGKTFVAANLAISLARQTQSRTVLIDMDMRRPSLARVLGVKQQDSLRWFLDGAVPASQFLLRVGANLALGLNSARLRDAGEVIQAPSTAHALSTIQSQFDPDVILYDLPPMLTGDDVTGFLPNLDCVLLVIGGGLSKPSEVAECERLLEDHCPLLGVVLNRGEGVKTSHYDYT